jgi:L-ribulokinase
MTAKHAIGVDFGTNSVRALVVDATTGEELGTAVHPYEHGEAGIFIDGADPNLARQHPLDYVTGLEAAVTGALAAARGRGVSGDTIVGIGVDTTGSTPIPVDREGIPLAFKDEFKDNPNAMAWLWKDHTAHAEAARITELAAATRPEYLARCGGTYSSEWFWSKLLHCLHVDRAVFDAAHSWVECADFVPAWLCGNLEPDQVKRGVCAAGHKAMYAADWGGLPDAEFLGRLAPGFASVRDRLYETALTSDIAAGTLSDENAKRLGLAVGTPVAVGAFDAHTGGVGAGIKPGVLVKVIGTSTCDMAVQANAGPVPEIVGLCGIVDGSILPGYWGFEAGQSAVGDIFNWFVKFGDKDHEELTAAASKMAIGESGLVALDWHNGNRTILVDPKLSGLIVGMHLHTKPEEVYRALIEATAFGARAIVETLVAGGVPIHEVICCGGIAEKNALLMQIYADVLKMPMRISRSSQTCALGSAIFGAVVGGVYCTAEEAQQKMTGLKGTVYVPNAARVAAYDGLYAVYRTLHDSFGRSGNALYGVMKDLIAIRTAATSRA